MVGVGFQKQRVHVGMAGDACCFGLHGLGTAYLQSFGCGITIQRHVLCLEGCWSIAILTEDAAEGCGNNALSDIAARSCKHDGMKDGGHICFISDRGGYSWPGHSYT